MAGYMIAEIWCDSCGTRIQIEDLGTLTELRTNLHEDGWCWHRTDTYYGLVSIEFRRRFLCSHQKLVDFCPGCCPIHEEA